MGEVRDRVDALEDEQDRMLRDRKAAARRVSDWSVLTLVVGSVLSFGILLFVYLNLDREIARRRQSEQRVLQLNRLYAVLSRTSQSIVRIRERDALFRAVCRIAVEDGLFRMAWVGTVNPQTGFMEPAAFAGFEDGYLGRIHIATTDTPEGQGPTGQAPSRAPSFSCAPISPTIHGSCPWRDDALARGYRSSAAFPIQFGDSVAGVFTLYAAEPGFFDEELVAVLNEAASEHLLRAREHGPRGAPPPGGRGSAVI